MYKEATRKTPKRGDSPPSRERVWHDRKHFSTKRHLGRFNAMIEKVADTWLTFSEATS